VNDGQDEHNATDLRPRAVLAVGITGHRGIGVEDDTAAAVAAAFDAVFRKLVPAFANAAVANAAFFSGERPVLRAICMAADGADLLGARAARDSGADLAVVLPFSVDEYKKDFTSAAALRLFGDVLASASTRFELSGSHAEGARAYERANEVIVANADLLVAVWDGKKAAGRAGTGDVVPGAVARSIPVIVIDPQAPSTPRLLLPREHGEIDLAVDRELKWSPLPADLTPLVMERLSPPSALARRRGLIDLLAEAPRSANWRVEHPALLKAFGVARTPDRPRALQPLSDAAAWQAALRNVRPLDTALAARLERLAGVAHRIDGFAAYYGQLFRSSAVSRFFLIIAVAFLSGLIGTLFPSLFGASIILQVAVSILILVDGKVSGRRRWQERWLDYRLLTERLRGLRFLHPLGAGSGETLVPGRRSRDAWTDWYVRRTVRALGAPAGAFDERALSAMSEQLIAVEIAEQIGYHRRAFRQLGKLERRLALAANAALGTVVALGGALAAAAYLGGGLDSVSWRPAANILLAALPAAMTAFNGIRADSDLVRLVERSAITAAALARLSRATRGSAMTYDRLTGAAIHAVSIMASERAEWRFVLESRRARTSRRRAIRRSRFKRLRRAKRMP
jgi:hypothetical protein